MVGDIVVTVAVDARTVGAVRPYHLKFVFCRREYERIKFRRGNVGTFLFKLMIAEHGPEVVRKFIDACFDEYRPTREYPGLSFSFMYCYQRARVLPRVLADMKRAELTHAHEVDNEDLADWL